MQARIKDEYKTIFFRDKLVDNEGQIFHLKPSEIGDYRFTSEDESEKEPGNLQDHELDLLKDKFDRDPDSLSNDELRQVKQSLGLDMTKRKSKTQMIEDLIAKIG